MCVGGREKRAVRPFFSFQNNWRHFATRYTGGNFEVKVEERSARVTASFVCVCVCVCKMYLLFAISFY